MLKIRHYTLAVFLLFGTGLLFPFISYAQRAKKLTKKERKLIESNLPNQAFKVLTIDNKKDSVFLRKKAKKVNLKKNTPAINYLSKRLISTLKDPKYLGVGIAAPQIGLSRQVIVVQRFDKKEAPFGIYINPIIRSCSKEKKLGEEGCLSIPDYSAKVFRPIQITVEYLDLEGKKHIEDVDGFTSVIFQHEIDHLNGILFIDHLSESYN